MCWSCPPPRARLLSCRIPEYLSVSNTVTERLCVVLSWVLKGGRPMSHAVVVPFGALALESGSSIFFKEGRIES